MLSLLSRIKRRYALTKKRVYKIGKYSITLPPNHMLDVYQESYRNYDLKLPLIARLVEQKYGEMSFVDIGANIGDTAAAVRNVCECAIICIEGNSRFIPWLEGNIEKLPGINRLIPKFIGPEDYDGVLGVITLNGTARIDRGLQDPTGDIQDATSPDVITYGEAVSASSDLPEVRFVKIDTDGFDFEIILGAIDKIRASHPVLFFEFDPSFSPENKRDEALRAVDELVNAGYGYFVIYDNYGNYMCSFSNDMYERFEDLFFFLEQSRINNGGVVYLDVCCFASKDQDVFAQLVATEKQTRSDSKLASDTSL